MVFLVLKFLSMKLKVHGRVSSNSNPDNDFVRSIHRLFSHESSFDESPRLSSTDQQKHHLQLMVFIGDLNNEIMVSSTSVILAMLDHPYLPEDRLVRSKRVHSKFILVVSSRRRLIDKR